MTKPAGTPATAPCSGQKPLTKLAAELAAAGPTKTGASRSVSHRRASFANAAFREQQHAKPVAPSRGRSHRHPPPS